MKWAHSGAYSRHWATNIHIGCNSCGRIFNPNEAWVECHLLKPNQDFPAGARPPWTGGKSGLNPGDRVAHIWIPQGFGLGSAPHGSWYFAVPYICVGLQRWKDVGNRTEGSRHQSSAQVMSGGVCNPVVLTQQIFCGCGHVVTVSNFGVLVRQGSIWTTLPWQGIDTPVFRPFS